MSVEINTKHDGSESKGNHRLLITNYSQENNNLGFRNKILQKERNISSDTNTHPMSTGWTISVHDIPVSKTTELVNCSGHHERRAAEGYKTYFSKATEEGSIRKNQDVRCQLDNSIDWSILRLSLVSASTPNLSDQSNDNPIAPGIIDNDISIVLVPTGDKAINGNGAAPRKTLRSGMRPRSKNDDIEPAFLKEEDYPPGWLVYHPVLGVVPKTEADRYPKEEEVIRRRKAI